MRGELDESQCGFTTCAVGVLIRSEAIADINANRREDSYDSQ